MGHVRFVQFVKKSSTVLVKFPSCRDDLPAFRAATDPLPGADCIDLLILSMPPSSVLYSVDRLKV